MPSSSDTLPPLSPSIAVAVCGPTCAARGKAIHERGDVIAASVDRMARELMGVVLGSRPDPYVQLVRLAPERRFENRCSCPMAGGCKHVAALLHHYIAHREELLGLVPPAPPAPARGPLERWLDELDGVVAASAAAPVDAPVPGRQVLLYQLDEVTGTRSGRGGSRPVRSGALRDDGRAAVDFRLSVLRSRLLVRGGFGKEGVARLDGYYLPDWCTSLDRDILRAAEDAYEAVYRTASGRTAPDALFVGRDGARLLELLARSGRCFLGKDRTRPLATGGGRPLVLDWVPGSGNGRGGRGRAAGERSGEGAALRLEATLDGAGDEWRLIGTDPPWYLDGQTLAAGPIDGAPPAAVLDVLLAAPELDTESARRASVQLAARLADAVLPVPRERGTHVVDEPPVPVLRLRSRAGSDDPRDFLATLAMRYGADAFAYEGASVETRVTLDDADGRRVVVRRPGAELRHELELTTCCPALAVATDVALARGDFTVEAEAIGAAVAAWRDTLGALPELEALGWLVETEPPFGLEFERIDDVDADVSESGNGWFELALAMSHGGERFALLPLIVEWLEAGEPEHPLLVRAESGAWLEIAPVVFRPVADTLLELFDTLPEGEVLRLPTRHALLLDELERRWREGGGGATWRGGEALFALAERLRRFGGIEPATLPDTVVATLRPYQLEGVAWLGFLAEYGFGGILADDMGLGKTLQTLAHLAREKAAGRLPTAALVVAPTSLLGNWAREAERFLPSFRTLVWHGAARHERGLDAREHDLVVTSYALALRDLEQLADEPFGYLVLDEAQTIKNPVAKTTRAVKALPVERRLCLTGTPLENHLGELHSQFDFLMPDYLGDRDRFARRFRTPIEKHGDVARQARLNELVQPFMLRRRKEEVASDLPPKTDIVQNVTLGAEQARLYESIRLSMEKKVRKLLAGKGLARSHIELLDALLKLRQTCCHPALVKLASARGVHESAKTVQLMAMLEELVAEGRRVLVFSQFTEMLALIERELDARGIAHVKLTGRTRKRDAVIDDFQSGRVPLFLISLKAGGTGLNLTAADTVIHYDPWWNPAVEAQASARAHRIGQDKPVFVYRLVATDTVEERILAMQARKQRLADATIEGKGAALGGLTAEDLLGLFAKREGES